MHRPKDPLNMTIRATHLYELRVLEYEMGIAEGSSSVNKVKLLQSKIEALMKVILKAGDNSDKWNRRSCPREQRRG